MRTITLITALRPAPAVERLDRAEMPQVGLDTWLMADAERDVRASCRSHAPMQRGVSFESLPA